MELSLNRALISLGVLVLTIPLMAQQFADTNRRDYPRNPSPREFEKRVNAAVTSSYESLSGLGLNARREIYSTLGTEMKRDLWLLHFDRFVAANPSLTPEQASVISDARALIAFGFFQNVATGSQGRDRWLEAASMLEERGRLAFPRRSARIIFFELGGPSDGLLDFTLERDTCTCSSESDWCDWITNPDPNCNPGGCTRTTAGCGTFWEYGCNGICGP